jgi:hypothetical protein
MDFLRLVLDGWANKSDRKNLPQYFFRQYKQAERDHFYTKDVFFNNCLDVIAALENDIEEQINKEIYESDKALYQALRGTIEYAEEDKTKTKEQRDRETIESMVERIRYLRHEGRDGFSVMPYILIPYNYVGKLNLQDLAALREAINKANEEAPNDLFNSKKDGIPNSSQRQKNKLSFELRGKNIEEDLHELYDQMRGRWITDKNTEDDFKAIFKAKPLNSITPIKWHDDNASELIFFYLKLMFYGILDETKRADYSTLTQCFVKYDGSPFNRKSFASLKQNIGENLSPQKQSAIIELLEKF